TFKDTRVGSGLTFKLPVPVPLSAVKELKIWDEETIGKDKQIDRVDRPAREVDGEKFHFALTGYVPPHSHQWKVGLALSICAGASRSRIKPGDAPAVAGIDSVLSSIGSKGSLPSTSGRIPPGT